MVMLEVMPGLSQSATTLPARRGAEMGSTEPPDTGKLSLQPVAAPSPAATGGRTCPKCSYRRRPEDTAPAWQCPRCGIAYEKAALPPATARRAEERAERDARAVRARPAPSRWPWLFLAAAIGATGWWGYTRWQAKRAAPAAAKEAAVRTAAIAAAGDALAVEADIAKAEEHLRMARPAEGMALLESRAAQGHASAMMALGVAYQGFGHAKADPAKAEEWMRRAANEGSLLAYVHLGLAAETGRGAPRSIEQAANHYRTAARGGNPYGLYALGLLYARGADGFPADPAAAAMLFELAHLRWQADPKFPTFAPHSRSPHSAEYEAKQLATKGLSPVDAVKAKEWAAAWKPGDPFPFQ
jgi:ribosomal protein L37AE/L43A